MKARWDLYDNFEKREFDCKRTGRNNMQHEFMVGLQQLRHEYGLPIVVNSGYRDPTHPVEAAKKLGPGVHTLGIAADIAVDRGNAYRLIYLAIKIGFTGIGVKQHGVVRFIHLDMAESTPYRIRPTIWSYR